MTNEPPEEYRRGVKEASQHIAEALLNLNREEARDVVLGMLAELGQQGSMRSRGAWDVTVAAAHAFGDIEGVPGVRPKR